MSAKGLILSPCNNRKLHHNFIRLNERPESLRVLLARKLLGHAKESAFSNPKIRRGNHEALWCAKDAAGRNN